MCGGSFSVEHPTVNASNQKKQKRSQHPQTMQTSFLFSIRFVRYVIRRLEFVYINTEIDQ